VIPLLAAVWLVVGLEPLEDRRLLEAFGDDFGSTGSGAALVAEADR